MRCLVTALRQAARLWNDILDGAMKTKLSQMSAWFQENLPAETTVAVDRIAPGLAFDAEEERAILSAVQSRRDEFRTGRRLARVALDRLGCTTREIPVGADRAPIWPKGYLGTISHSGGICVACVGRTRDFAGIGVDIEVSTRLEPDLLKIICHPEDMVPYTPVDAFEPGTFLFVCKEALYKAYYPATGAFLEFHDVCVRIIPKSGLFEARLMNPLKPALQGARTFVGRCAAIGDHVAAALWIGRA